MSRKSFTEEQKEYLKNRKDTPRSVLTRMFNEEFGEECSLSSISSFCSRHKLSNEAAVFSEEQKQFLIENYDIPHKELLRQFNEKFGTDRDLMSIRNFGVRYGVKKEIVSYSEEQIAFLKENDRIPRKVLTDMFNERFKVNKTYSQIAELCKKLGLVNSRTYTEEQQAFLEQHSSLMSRKELTDAFNAAFGTDFNQNAVSSYCVRRGWEAGNIKTSPPHAYTKEQLQFLEENYDLPRKELADAFNNRFGTHKTVEAMIRACARYGFTKGHIDYTSEQKLFLQENSAGLTRKELTCRFNEKFSTSIPERTITAYCNRRGWFSGNDGRYKNGNVPWHAGLYGDDYKSHFSEESLQKLRECLDGSKYKVGDEIIRHGEIMVVVSTDYSIPYSRRLKFKRRVVYEEAYGPIPEGYKIIHLNGDHTDCSLDNLYCIPNRYIPLINHNGWLMDNREHTLTAIKLCELHYALADSKSQKNSV